MIHSPHYRMQHPELMFKGTLDKKNIVFTLERLISSTAFGFSDLFKSQQFQKWSVG